MDRTKNRTRQPLRPAPPGREPLTDRLQLTALPPHPAAPKAARALVDVACAAWDFPDLLHPARLVLSELVANGVRHARTSMVVTVWRRDTGLHLSVHDRNPVLPGLVAADRTRHGLTIIDVLSADWGATATRDGKLVWATMRSCRRR